MKIQEIPGKDGLYRCAVCGRVTRRQIALPLFDGASATKPVTVRILCRCQEEAEERERARKKAEADMEAVRELKKLSLMDAKLRDASFSNYEALPENRQAYTIAERYVERFPDMLRQGQGILFCGPAGSGKSYTAAAITNELMNRRHPAIMTSFVKLLDAMSGFQAADEDYIERLNHAELLFIDDLGAERGTDTALEKVYNIVDSRYRSRKPLLLTTNLTLGQIRDETDIRYVRIYDRVVEMCYPVKMDGMRWRKWAAASHYKEMKRLLEG